MEKNLNTRGARVPSKWFKFNPSSMAAHAVLGYSAVYTGLTLEGIATAAIGPILGLPGINRRSLIWTNEA